jgi:hypothetical protein
MEFTEMPVNRWNDPVVDPNTTAKLFMAVGVGNANPATVTEWFVIGPEGEVAVCRGDGAEGRANMIVGALNEARVRMRRHEYQVSDDGENWRTV